MGNASHCITLEEGLRDYLVPSSIKVVSLKFDLGMKSRVTAWPRLVAEELSDAHSSYKHVIVTLTDHTDADTGDLFLGRTDKGKTVAAAVDQVGYSN